MAGEIGRSAKLEYRANANLVLEADRSGRRNNEPTGEAESLVGKLGITRMGDRVAHARPAELDERLSKAKKKRERATADADAGAKKKRGGGSYLDATAAANGLRYVPRNKDTRASWEQLLSMNQRLLGDLPHEYLAGAAEEVVAVVRDPELREGDKKSKVADILGRGLAEDVYSRIVSLSNSLTDFRDESSDAAADSQQAAGMDDVGVAVVFDEGDDEDNDEYVDQLVDEEGDAGEGDDEAVDGAEEEAGAGVHVDDGREAAADAADPDAADKAAGLVPVREIDAFWLQRQVSRYVADSVTSHKTTTEIMSILGSAINPSAAADVRAIENQLVALLEFDKFDLIKLIVKNAARVYYITRLRHAQSDSEKASIRSDMAADMAHGGPHLLKRLDESLSSDAWAQSRAANASERVRKEARELAKVGSNAAAGGGAGDDRDVVVGASAPSSLALAAASRPERTLDLEQLSFQAGSHLMANKKVLLPDKSWRAQKKGYEEVHVPAMKPRELQAGEREIPIAELPDWSQAAFKGMQKLNRVQSRLYETALFSAENMLLCAPTGAGKTNVAVLSIMHELGMHRQEDGSLDLSSFKIIYVAPMKALVQEVVANFTQRLSEPYGIVVRELSGDQSLTKAEIAETQIIVTTPEKWDVITRKAGERTYTQLVRLIIIDEIHLLHDERGPVLEALVARTLRQVEVSSEMIRIVGLSATLPNYEDVATFLRVKPDRGLFVFDNSFRPAPLQQQYIGVTEKKPLKRLHLMNEICYEKVLEQAGKNQVLIFVHSRKETARTAKALKEMFVANGTAGQLVREDGASREILVTEAEATARDTDLKELLPYGFGIHHAGMQRTDRTLVEELFSDGHVQVLVSTATLAWGVNLPAHTVIIKGTQIYNPEKGKWTELSPLDVMQMLGRAGRPQYDTFGEGIILTGHSELQYYLSLMNQQLPIESQLVSRLADNLNAEIVLGTVANVKDAAQWLSYTYLYVRMLRNPTMYGVDVDGLAKDTLLLQRRLDLVHSAAVLLDRHNLIRYDKRSGIFQSTALGRVASFYYITHPTIATYNEFLKPTLTDLELFRLFSLSAEFKNIVVRQEEKEELRKLLERVPVPVKETMEEPSAKVNVLLQAYISKLKLDGFALMADMTYIHQSAARLMRAIFEICLRRGWGMLAHRALDLCKMIDHRQWQSNTPLRQFVPSAGGLPEDILQKLEKKAIPWSRYYDLKAGDLGELVRNPKLGKAIHRLVHSIPRLELQAHLLPITRTLLKVDVVIEPDFLFDPKIHGGSEVFWVFVEDQDGENILHNEQFTLKARYATEEHRLSFYVPITDPTPPHYFLRVVSDRWLHSESMLCLSFRSLVLPDKFPPHTELLDLAPLPVSALGKVEYITLYGGAGGRPKVDLFNPIQTQTYPALFETDHNVLVAAPSGSGKTVCAEFALLRLFSRDPEARGVYIAAHAAVCKQRYEEWEPMFGAGLGKAVVELTGELTADVKLLERCHIAIATPKQWDAVSRRWKKRRVVQEVSLYIVDELDTLGSDATYEVVVSRVRLMALQLEKPIRIVALSNGIANARDIGDWIGAGPATTFNFLPQSRPTPLEIRIQGFDNPSFSIRLMGMARPAYQACAQRAGPPTRSTNLVFVPSRKQAQLTAIDMLSFAAADGKSDLFLRCAPGHLDEVLAAYKVETPVLKHVLRKGIGFWHEGLPDGDKAAVMALFASGAIGVVVAPAAATWCMGSSKWAANTVVIMGTESYDGRQHKYVDYPMNDLLHMMGRAVKPSADGLGRCVLLCAATRKEYLKKFLYEPLPVESALHTSLHDHMNAEVVNKLIETKQDALDYLTWTLLYRRLAQNPNFYSLAGTSHRHLSDYLSELVDSTLNDLEGSQCVEVQNEMDVTPLNLGMIAAYYYIAYTTLEVFASSVAAKTKLRGLIEVVSNATEYDTLPIRHGEEHSLRSLATHVPLALPPPAEGQDAAMLYHDSHIKANLMLQAHFSRRNVPGEMKADQARVIEDGVNLVQALVDVISSEGWLKPALAAMELSQMLVQGLWADKDPVLLQVPHFTRELADKCAAFRPDSKMQEDGDDEEEEAGGIEQVFQLMDLDDGVRRQLLGFTDSQMADVAHFCNRYPNIDVKHEVATGDSAAAGETVSLLVNLQREANTEGLTEGAGIGAVFAPRFPKPKSENWWLVVGQPSLNSINAIKRVTLSSTSTTQLEFPVPEGAEGPTKFRLYFMSDSYMGADQEYDFVVDVVPAAAARGDGEMKE